jgi:hypothetical protein
MSPFDRQPKQEIIPPGAPLPRDRGVWTSGDVHRTHYVYSTRLGPVGLTLLTLGAGAATVLGLLFLLSAAFVGLAVIGAVTVAAVVAGILRRFNQPLR